MNCDKCNGEIKRHETMFNKYTWCTTCFSFEVSPHDTCCNDPKLIYVQKGFQLRQQCTNCWNVIGGALKKDTVSDFKGLPILNQPKREAFYKEKWDEQTRFQQWVEPKKREYERNLFLNEHNVYLKSDQWRQLRLKILERDRYICQSCLTEKATQVHHLTYERWKKEAAFDLTSVCDKCHERIHS